ncbi:hypothetical protein TNCV_4013841 [Trichonephila clavipes]|nr:hypothetical protein TNCV_4013841 [Trichonephila clavipes]
MVLVGVSSFDYILQSSPVMLYKKSVDYVGIAFHPINRVFLISRKSKNQMRSMWPHEYDLILENEIRENCTPQKANISLHGLIHSLQRSFSATFKDMEVCVTIQRDAFPDHQPSASVMIGFQTLENR